VVLASAEDIYDFETRKSKKRFFGLSKSSSSQSITQLTNRGVSIAAAGDIDVIAEAGDLTTAGSRFASASGDINLSAVEGDIYAGTYTDIFRNETKRSRSFLFGLISSSSARTTLDRFNTGTDALAAIDLSLVSGADTTLVGANLSAGGKLTIDTGGDFSVKAAIDSQRSEFFSSKMGLVTMTTITEKSFVETAVFTQLLAGQGLSLTIGGDANLALYTQAGVDQPTPEDLYPKELLALAGLKLLTQDLANDHFHDKQTQLSPAFKALVSIAIGNFIAPGLVAGILPNASGWLVTAAESFTTSFMVGSLDGLVSGNFDLGDILKDATFSGVTAGLTAGIDIKFPVDHPFNDALINGFGTTQFTMAGLLNAGLDGVISSGLSSAVYGTDFGSGVLNSIVTYVANGVAGAGIEEIADRYGHSTFSVEKLVAKAMLNCLAAEAKGASCASGAVGSLVTELALNTGTTFGAKNSQELRDRLQLAAAIAAYFVSEGEAANVYAAADAALLDLDNNDFAGIGMGLVLLMNRVEKDCIAAGGDAASSKALATKTGMDFVTGMGDAAFVAADLLIDLIPVVGDVKGAVECVNTPSAVSCGGTLLGIIPLAGDGAKILLKHGGEVIEFTKHGDDVVDATRGRLGDWNKELNNPRPNATYKLDNGDVYVTDAQGRVTNVQAELRVDPNDRNNYRQRIAGGECRQPDDCGGHLIGAVFGGAGEGINLVPMDKVLNGSGGQWYELEKTWKAALNAGRDVKVDIKPKYTGNSTRPESFVVKYEIAGVPQSPRQIFNTPTGMVE